MYLFTVLIRTARPLYSFICLERNEPDLALLHR